MARAGNWSSSSGSGGGGAMGNGNYSSKSVRSREEVTTASQEEHLMVAVRILPTVHTAERCIEVISDNSLLFSDGGKSRRHKYSYDYVFKETTSQENVYRTTTAPLVQDVLNGLNSAVFAYGATGSGKTFTMLGPSHSRSNKNASIQNTVINKEDGIMIRAIAEIYDQIERNKSDGLNSYKISISYLEIYNELIKDLLSPGGPLELREDNRGQRITVAGLSEITTSSQNEVIALLIKGNKARTMEPTAANQTSSRSHALLSITVQNKSSLGVKQGRLFLIDLAGSERAKKTKNRGKRLQEGAHINRSLLALGNCINALSGGARYVNYRDSKLTRLLKEALSGKCKTVMIAHIAPGIQHRNETRNTLIYADRANSITTRLQNSIYIDEAKGFPTQHYQNLISELRDEVLRLRSKMPTDIRPASGAISAATKNASKSPATVEDETKRKSELKYLREQIVFTFKQQMKLRRKLLETESHLLGLELDAERQHMIISHWQGRLGKLYDATALQDRDVESDGNLALKNAWGELAAIEKESRRNKEIRERTEHELELCRQKGVQLEDQLPEHISNDEERELLALLCRVHELEADKVSLQAERLARRAELRRRDLQLLRAERQRRLCEDIISSQRRLLDEQQVELPDELKDLYNLYQQEIYAGTVTPSTAYERKVPPIYTPSSESSASSSSSEFGPSTPMQHLDEGIFIASAENAVLENSPDRHMGPSTNMT